MCIRDRPQALFESSKEYEALSSVLDMEIDSSNQAKLDQEAIMKEVAETYGSIQEQNKQQIEQKSMLVSELEQLLHKNISDGDEKLVHALQVEQEKVQQLELVLEQTRAMSKAFLEGAKKQQVCYVNDDDV